MPLIEMVFLARDSVTAKPARDALERRLREMANSSYIPNSRVREAIILGCTEIGLLLRPEDTSIALFDTTRLHAEAAASFALDEQQ